MTPEEKVAVVKSFASEIIKEDELLELFKNKKEPIAYDGFEPSGQIHIAQGLMRTITVNKLTSIGVRFKFWVADWFGMLNNKMDGDLNKIRIVGEYFIEVWKACGMDMSKVEFVWTSEFINSHPEYWETVMKLSMNATVQRVLRCGQIMGREDSASNPAAQILYPIMQAADIHHLQADIAQLGMDQRKVNMLARDVFPKIGLKSPVAVHHHMLLGLKQTDTDATGVDRKIAMKMSKSKPNTAIFMTDSSDDVARKFKKAYCPEKQVEDNPVLEYLKHIVFEKVDSVVVVDRDGGEITFDSYDSIEAAFVSGDVHPADLKSTTAKYVDELLEPVRQHFATDARAKKLAEQVASFSVTR